MGSRRNSSLGSLVSRTRGLRIETADGYNSDEADEEEEEGERQHVQVDLQFVDEPQDVASNNNNNTMIVAQSQQIPMDFDAVPIVSAPIIPFDAIHAEVMEDGVIYY